MGLVFFSFLQSGARKESRRQIVSDKSTADCDSDIIC